MAVVEKEWAKEGKLVEIQHARSPQGEKVITCQGLHKLVNYKVDGYLELDGKKYVYEYNGCNFHGCKTCFPHSRDSHMNNRVSMEVRWKNTKLKEQRLKEAGYIVKSKWSCEFVQDKLNEDVREFVESLNIQDPINLRECYFGGRTNGIVLHKKFTNGEKGKYVDFTSLYPDILKYRRFPIGHEEWAKEGKLVEIQHARSPQGEKVITCQGLHKLVNYKVDGYLELDGKKYVYEYNGCNFHGCKTCFPHSRDSHMNNRVSMEVREKYQTERAKIERGRVHCEE